MEKLRIAACVALSALSACSLIYASDLHDADHGASLGPEAGGTSSGSDGPPGPGGGPGPEGGLGEAGPDGGPVASSVGCASLSPAPKFCDDFDDSGTVGARWDAVEQQGTTAVVSFDSIDPYSAPNAMKAVLATAPTCTYSRLDKTFTGVGPNRQEVRFKVRPVEPWGNSKDRAILAIQLDGARSGHCQLVTSLTADGTGHVNEAYVNAQTLQPTETDDVRPLNGFAKASEWTEHYVIAVPGDGGVQVTTGFSGGTAAGEQAYVFPECQLGSTLGVQVGFHCTSGDASVLYDDVRVDWQ
jgi:hypothetical protein